MVEALFQISEPGESRVKSACLRRVVGIDLGTTNSLVARVVGGQPVCLPDETGARLLPSAVHYGADGQVVVGRRARDDLAPSFPRDTILSVKRFMGRGPEEAETSRTLVPYAFVPAAEGQSTGVVRFSVAGGARTVTPVEVSAEILRVLRERAEAELGGPIEGAVITVPAYFDDAQRQATRDAGRLAGLSVMRLVNEPTAAALAYGLDRQRDGTFAVFDLGGGTFDVSILLLQDGVFEVKSTGGDSALGGDDFDRVIAEELLLRMGASAATTAARGADAGADAQLARRVLAAARLAKEALSQQESVEVAIPMPEGTTWRDTLSRARMEELVGPVLERCAGPVKRALRDAGLAPEALDAVVLVGGATRMPLVRRFVASLFGKPPLCELDPDLVVALGAAAQAELLAGGDNPGDVVLLDVVPLSLGLELMGGVVEKLIHRNTTIPCGARQVFTTYADNQTGFDLHVVQGERELAAECRSLARFRLGGLPPGPAGMARLEVTFSVDADGILAVAARELATGKEASIEVRPSYGLTDAEVEAMLLASFEHGEKDVRARLLAEQRVEAERILSATRAALAATPELLAEGEAQGIEAAIDDLLMTARGEDTQAIRAAIEALDRASKDFAQRRMNRALERGFAGRALEAIEGRLGGAGDRSRHERPESR